MDGLARADQRTQAAPEPDWHELWQVPTFLVGVLAFATVIAYSLVRPTPPAVVLQQTLLAAERALAANDIEAAQERLEAALLLTDQVESRRGEVLFLRGKLLAQQGDSASGSLRADFYAKARVCFQAAEQAGIPKELGPMLRYKLAVAEYYAGGKPQKAAQEIQAVLGELPAERVAGYALLVEIYLNSTPPDREAALQANERLLAQAGLTNPNPARLQRGELLLLLDNHEEAQLVLSRIPADAPEFPKARHLRALSHSELGEWSKAVELWEPAVAEAAEPTPELAQALYGLGVCYLALNQTSQAQSVWQRVEREVPRSPETTMAAFKLALLHAAAHQHEDALAQFRQALSLMTPDWKGPYADAARLRPQVEGVWSAWLEAGQYASALELARLYGKIALAGESARRCAAVRQREGVAALRQAERLTGDQRQELVQLGRRCLHEAAGYYEEAVRAIGLEGDSADMLWLAAENYLQAQEPERAAAILETLLSATLTFARRQEAQLALGEAYQALRKSEAAAVLLKQSAETEGPLQLRARYLYALVLIDQNKYEEAEAVLRQIMVMPLLERGMEELRLARFALVHVLFKREAYADAADYLEKALATDPDQPQLIATRYWLAEAYRRAARQDRKSLSAADSGAAREFYVKQKRLQLEKARELFAQVITGLQQAGSQSPLAPEELVRLRESRLGLGEALIHLGRYEEAAGAYRGILDQEPPSLASVTAALHLTQCHLTLKQLDEARQSAARGLEILDQVSDRDLAAGQTDRAVWKEWFKNAAASTLPSERSQEGSR